MAYVDIEKLKKNIRVNLIPNVDIDGTVTVEDAERYFLNMINKTSAVDVVEVIRCKDCKRCELRYPVKAIGEEAIEGYYCHPNQRYVKSTDFCSYGTPKERSECDG